MSPPVAVTARGWLSPLGDTPDTFFAALAAPPAPAPITGFACEGPTAVAGHELRDFDPREVLGNRNFRPLNRPALFAVTAAQRALTDAGLEAEAIPSLGLVLGTMFGSIQTIADFDLNAQKVGPKYAKPMDFANTVINAPAGQTAIWHNLQGINSTLCSGAVSGLQALGYGAGLIADGRAHALLSGGVEELSYTALLGFAGAGLVVPDGAPRGTGGFTPGEGAALLLLEDAAHAQARGATALAYVTGYAGAYDAGRVGDPAQTAAAVVRAVRAALDQAGITPSDIDVVLTATSGHDPTDQAEALALAELWPEGKPACFAPKSRTGEVLGASGAFAAVTALEIIARGRMPEPAGNHGETALNTDHVLLTAVGYEGSCYALVLSAAAPR